MSEICENEVSKIKIRWSTWIIGFSLLIIDQLTKYFALLYLAPSRYFSQNFPYGGVGIFHDFFGIDFSLNFMTNKGAAWGMLGDYQVALMIFRIILIIGLIIFFLYYNTNSSWQIPLALIIFGAIGNVIDFFLYGYVIDMFHFVFWGYDFAVFNVADSAITVGIILLALVCKVV